MRAAGLTLLLVLAVPAVALAGTPLDRARELADRGKLDDADKALDAAQGSLAGAELRAARRLRAEIAGRRPERASFEKAVAQYRALAAEDDEDVETRWALYELVWSRGERLVTASQKVDEPAPLVREARETFSEGAKLLEAEWRALDAKGTDAAFEALAACGFYWPRCLAALGRLDGDKALLERAVERWLAYSERFGTRPEGYEAACDLAEALVELGRPDEALAAAESGVAVEDALGAAPESALLEIFERASLVKTQVLLARGAKDDVKKAVAAAERGLARVPAVDRTALANLLRIEHAEAKARDGDSKTALAELERVAALDPTGSVGDLALQRLARLTGSLAGISSERALRHMNAALERGQAGIALSQARAALRAAKAEGERDAALAALEGMGRSFEAQRRIVEARLAYEEVAAASQAPSELAARSALGAVRCAEQERVRDPGPHANATCARALALLEERDPAARKGLAPFLLAKQLQDAGRFADAAKSYDAVAADAGAIHDEALYAGACCRYVAARGDKAALAEVVKRLDALLARPAPRATGGSTAVTTLRERAKLLLAEVVLQQGTPERVLELLDGASEPALQYRAIALVRLGRLEQAESLVGTLVDRRSTDRRTASACRELVLALEKQSASLPEEPRRAVRARLARYLAVCLEDATPRQATLVAQEAFGLALSVLGLSERGGFVIELDGEPAAAKPLLDVAARGFERGVAAAKGPHRVSLLAARAQALGFAGDWKNAAAAFGALSAETKLLAGTGELDERVLLEQPLLLWLLADQATCELRAGDREVGRAHLARVVEHAKDSTRLWWLARLELLRDDERRGTKEAFAELDLSLRALARKYPGFEAAKELAPRFLELAKKRGL